MDDEQRFIPQAKEAASKQQVLFHLPFHPQLPPSAEIQHLWHHHVSAPPGKPQLHQLCNAEGLHIPVSQLIVAHCQDPNLGTILSYRKLCQRKGPKVSSYLGTFRGEKGPFIFGNFKQLADCLRHLLALPEVSKSKRTHSVSK
jgi:hypothetical protein